MEDKLVKNKLVVNKAALGFAEGFFHLFIGLKFAYVDHRELAKLYLPPMIFGLVFMLTGLLVFAEIVGSIVSWVWAEPEGSFFHFLWVIVRFLVWLLSAMSTIVMSFFIFMLAAAPFSDMISERVEGIIGTWEERPFSLVFLLKDLKHTFLLEFARLGIKLLWLLPLLLLSFFIPVIGQFIYLFVGGYLLAKFLGMDYVDWALARRGYSWSGRFEFARKNRWAILGFGTAMLLGLMIPLGFVILWPGAVAGGTILCTKLQPEDRRFSKR